MKKIVITVLAVVAVLAIAVIFAFHRTDQPSEINENEIALQIQLDLKEDVGLLIIDSDIDREKESGGISNADKTMLKKDDLIYWSIDKQHYETVSDMVELLLNFTVITEYCDPNYENIYPEADANVKGIISMYGALSIMFEDGMPSTLNHHQPDSPEGMEMGGVDLRNNPDLCRKMSVECNINEDTPLPPILMFHGTKDRTVNPKISVVVYKLLKKYNKNVKLYMLEGADHGGSEFFTERILDIIEEFIRSNISD